MTLRSEGKLLTMLLLLRTLLLFFAVAFEIALLAFTVALALAPSGKDPQGSPLPGCIESGGEDPQVSPRPDSIHYCHRSRQ